MTNKVKISRSFTFKAYVVSEKQEVLNDAHSGEFMLKSDCHYYAEKGVLDYVKANLASVKSNKHRYAIYKVCTLEDNKCEDVLVELITVKDDQININ